VEKGDESGRALETEGAEVSATPSGSSLNADLEEDEEFSLRLRLSAWIAWEMAGYLISSILGSRRGGCGLLACPSVSASLESESL